MPCGLRLPILAAMHPSRPFLSHPGARGATVARVVVACLALLGLPRAAASQLRPLDPLDWGALNHEGRTAFVGGGFYSGQRASLAGTEGRLLEVGAFGLTWGFGRVALRLSGTAVRFFDDSQPYASPIGGALPFQAGRRRTDTGDYRISTLVGFTAPASTVGLAMRFGVRLPTTDNVKGLGRDQTDFFSSLSARVRGGPWTVSGEAGLGITGTRDEVNEQIDPLLFSVALRYRAGSVEPFLEAVGQHDTRAGPQKRGAEDLGEARMGVYLGGQRWLRLALVRGWTAVSPDFGIELRLGTRF